MIGRLRRWAEGYTSEGRFSPVGIAFHWVMAALVLFQLGYGWWTTVMPVGGDKLRAYEIHAGAGLAIFVLAFGRMLWRLMIKDPWNDADTQGWRSTLAYGVEHLFYACFFLLPLTGWAMWSAVAPQGPLAVAGILPWPQMPIDELPLRMQWQVLDLAETLHLWLVWLLMILTLAHVAAALKHHFWERDDVLSGMLPDVPDRAKPHQDSRRSATGPRLQKESAAD